MFCFWYFEVRSRYRRNKFTFAISSPDKFLSLTLAHTRVRQRSVTSSKDWLTCHHKRAFWTRIQLQPDSRTASTDYCLHGPFLSELFSFCFFLYFFVSVPSASLSSHLVSLWQLVCQLESSCQNFSVRICHRYSSSDRNTHTTLSLWFLITSFAHVPKKYTVSYRIGMDCRVTTSPVMIMNCNI